MKIEILKKTDDENLSGHNLLLSENIVIKIDGKEAKYIEEVDIKLDARSSIPKIIMTILPTYLNINLNGKVLQEWGTKD